MATRKAITLVSGLFQEVNTPTDKLDFAGNTTADLSENTNLYFTNARARGAVSVTDTGGFGELAYNSSTGVITYTGTSAANVRGTLSVASGSGLVFNTGTGEFTTSAIPNSQLANSAITLGSTSMSLGATVNTVIGMSELASNKVVVGVEDAANAIELFSGNIIFEGSTADANEIILTAADATGGDKTLTLPNETGTILTSASSIPNSGLANSSLTIGSTSVALGATASTIAGLTSLASTTLISGTADGANSITLASGNITFEGSSANTYETVLTAANPTGDATITLPNATGTVALLNTLSIDVASGLTYNSSTGQFGTNAIPNSKLANSSITIGGTGVALGGSITTFSGLSSVTADAVVTKTGGFRVIDSTDNTKQLAFDASAISGSTTRTLAVPDENGTLVTSGAIVNADINASAAIAGTKISPDFGSQTVTTTGTVNTGLINASSASDQILNLNSSDNGAVYLAFKRSGGRKAYFGFGGTGNTISLVNEISDGDIVIAGNDGGSNINMLSFNTSENGRATFSGNIITSGTISGTLVDGVAATTQSASDNSTKVATTAYVDNQVTAGAVNEFADNVFRVKDNSDASKKLAFECSGISGSTTRTMTVPNTDGTISTESFATAIAVALG